MQPLFNRKLSNAIVSGAVLVTSLATAALPPWTNSFYLTYDQSVFYHQGDQTFYKPEKIEEARLSKESRPAENDPEGNWGSVSEGFQLSLRFSKDTFMVGEPIVATIILRNITPDTLRCFRSHPISDYELFVIDNLKKRTPYQGDLRELYSRGSGGTMDMYAGMQWKYQLRVDELFDVTSPGAYLIYTKRMVQKVGKIEFTDVVSGNVSIRIVEAPKTAGQVNPVKTATPTVAPPGYLGTATTVGKVSPVKPHRSTGAAESRPTANPSESSLHSTPKAAANKTPAQLAQAETGGGMSSRDWVFGLLVLGVVLGLGWYLFRARSPHPKS